MEFIDCGFLDHLPALSFWGYWDNNLSSKLFSANIPRMIICVADTSKCKPVQRFWSKSARAAIVASQTTIDIHTWTIRKTGVSAYQRLEPIKQH